MGHAARAYGKIVDIQPLLEWRAGYRSAQADATVSAAARDLAGKNQERLRRLHRESIVATRELIQTEAQFAADSAKAQAAGYRVREMREAALQSWADTLYRLASSDRAGLFDVLLARSQLPGVATLPLDCARPQGQEPLAVAPAGSGLAAAAARIRPRPGRRGRRLRAGNGGGAGPGRRSAAGVARGPLHRPYHRAARHVFGRIAAHGR